ncbi:MAG: putative TrmH family tRNA/rRNA methyltransferase YacO [Bacillota bacterium]|jgi:23S rRNA (guanosine2251-2'-O)-methyltransferase
MEQYRYGKHAVEASIRSGKVKKVFLVSHFKDAAILSLIQSKNISVERLEDSRLTSLVQSTYHQGIVASVVPFAYTELNTFLKTIDTKKNPLLILLDGIEDPLNLGSMIRTAVGFGVDGLIIKKDRQVDVNPTVAKIASGALDYLPIIQVTNLSQTIMTLKEHRFWLVATALEGAQDYRSVDYQGPIGLIIGSEGDGISRLVLEHADFKVKIPIQHLNSFNAATSVAIMLGEVYRQRFPLIK